MMKHSAHMRSAVHGFTLIELIVAIVVIGIGVTSVAGVLTASAARSAETLMRYQAQGVARAYLNEVLSLPYADPVAPNGEVLRNQFDDVLDYNGLVDNGARDRGNNLIAGFNSYTVTVVVANVNIGAPGVPARRVTVTVRAPNSASVVVTGYRTNHL